MLFRSAVHEFNGLEAQHEGRKDPAGTQRKGCDDEHVHEKEDGLQPERPCGVGPQPAGPCLAAGDLGHDAPLERAGRLPGGKAPQEPVEILFLGGAHTGGDLSVWLPGKKILFLSETYLNRVFPAMRSASPDWLPSLDKAIAMKADLCIAGHGFTEDGPVSREEIGRAHV